MVHQLALDELAAALLVLPVPWMVLREAGAADDGNCLGASFVALHPERGIALVDLAPARLNANIPWLRIILIRAGGGAFTLREPPITSVLLSIEEIPRAAARIEASFADMPRCAIPEEEWPVQAIAALAAGDVHLVRLTFGSKPKFKPVPRSDALNPLRPGAHTHSHAPRERKQSLAAVQPSLAREISTPAMLRLEVPHIEAPTLYVRRADVARIALPSSFIAVPQAHSQPQPESPSPVASPPLDPTIDLAHPASEAGADTKVPAGAVIASAEPLPSIPGAASSDRVASACAPEDADPAPIGPGLGIEPEIAPSRSGNAAEHGRPRARGAAAMHAGLPSLREGLEGLRLRFDKSPIVRIVRGQCRQLSRSSAAFVLSRLESKLPRLAPWAVLALLLGVLSPPMFHWLERDETLLPSSGKEPRPQLVPIRETEQVAPPEEAPFRGLDLKAPDTKPANVRTEAERSVRKAEPSEKTQHVPAVVAASRYPVRSAPADNTASTTTMHKKAPRLAWEERATARPNNADPYDGPEYDYANRQSW